MKLIYFLPLVVLGCGGSTSGGGSADASTSDTSKSDTITVVDGTADDTSGITDVPFEAPPSMVVVDEGLGCYDAGVPPTIYDKCCNGDPCHGYCVSISGALPVCQCNPVDGNCVGGLICCPKLKKCTTVDVCRSSGP